MFDVDKLITETNKEMLYGKKPELPEKLGERNIYNNDGSVYGRREPDMREITEVINKIIDYLKWEEK